MFNVNCCFLYFFINYSGKKNFFTGGAGFIGSHVAQKLLERGDSVVIVDNMNDAYDQRIKEYNLSLVEATDSDNSLSIHKIDICDKDAIEVLCLSKTLMLFAILRHVQEFVPVLRST